jgi:hypothetical protein
MTDSFNVKDLLSIEVVSSAGGHDVAVVIEPLNGSSFYASTEKGERYPHTISEPKKFVFPSKNPRKLILSLKQLGETQRVLNVQLNSDSIYAKN